MRFYNISNHSSQKWGENQIKAAQSLSATKGKQHRADFDPDEGQQYWYEVIPGTIIDVPFPNVPPKASGKELLALAEKTLPLQVYLQDSAAMVQGEFALSKIIIDYLQGCGCRVYAACTERNTVELPDGRKEVQFSFVQFREYSSSSALADYLSAKKADEERREAETARANAYPDGDYIDLEISIKGNQIFDSLGNFLGYVPNRPGIDLAEHVRQIIDNCE